MVYDKIIDTIVIGIVLYLLSLGWIFCWMGAHFSTSTKKMSLKIFCYIVVPPVFFHCIICGIAFGTITLLIHMIIFVMIISYYTWLLVENDGLEWIGDKINL